MKSIAPTHATRPREGGWLEWAARAGLVARGVSYGLVATLALLLAAGRGGAATDRPGAFRTLADDPLGAPC